MTIPFVIILFTLAFLCGLCIGWLLGGWVVSRAPTPMKNTKISWCDHTFSPWLSRKRTSAAYWRQPLAWNRVAGWNERDAAACGRDPGPRPRVFCGSLCDSLDDEVPIEWLADLLALIHATPNLDWLLLTKQPENFAARIAAASTCRKPLWAGHLTQGHRALPSLAQTGDDWLRGDPPANVWLGTSVEDQQRADERIPQLLAIPAKVRFLSCEPLIAPVDLRIAAFNGADSISSLEGISWVIAGCESGPRRRPMQTEWARSLKDQCASAGVPFFFKQMEVAGKVVHDPALFPQDLRVQEFP